MSTFEKAKEMVGNRYRYYDQEIGITAVTDLDGLTTEVITDQKEYKFSISELARFIEKCKKVDVPGPVSSVPQIQPSPIDQQVSAFTNLLTEMGDVLKNDIEKIGEDPGYIPQAKARGNNVNSIINLMKVGISLHKK